MRTTLLSLLVAIGLLSACNKKDLTMTKVGFYVLNPTYTQGQDEYEYNLYIDQQYRGKLKVSTTETDDSTLMNFQTLDATKHIIKVQKGNTLVSSTYLQIGKCKGASGTGLQIDNYKNGFIYKNMTNMSYDTYGIFQ
jgi:hypothetical protein